LVRNDPYGRIDGVRLDIADFSIKKSGCKNFNDNKNSSWFLVLGSWFLVLSS
jgi:hypothetical protein